MDSNLNLYYQQQVKHNWDANVIIRAADLEQSTDYSYINFIEPWVINKVLQRTTEESNILDIGCGCGFLTNSIYKNGRAKIEGIDISPASISYAQKKYPYITFFCGDICATKIAKKYELCLAVMVLNNMPYIENFFTVVKTLLNPNGKLIIVLPHPCFWPKHHLSSDIYYYSQEIPYEFPFATKGRSDYTSNILYFHRTLETYEKYIQQNGFLTIDFQELYEEDSKADPDILCIELTTNTN